MSLILKDETTVSFQRTYSDASSTLLESALIETDDPLSSYTGLNQSYISQKKERSSSLVDLEELPQGRHLGMYATIVMFLTRIIGSGIWAAPSNIYVSSGGNYILYFAIWGLSAAVAFAGLFLYLELGSIIPRSGGTKIFLEYIYQRPSMLLSFVFGTFSLLFSLTVTNAIVFGKYSLYSLGYEEEFVSNSTATGYIALGLVVFASFIHSFGVKHAMAVQNWLGYAKIFLIIVMSFTGLYVLALPESITGIVSQFNADSTHFKEFKSQVTFNTISTGFLNCFFVFGGWSSVHMVTSEIKDPTRTLKIAGPVSLLIAFGNFMLINCSYLKVLTHEEISSAGPLIGSLLFEKIFGLRFGRQFLTLSIAFSAFSNVFVVIYALSRVDQEIFREGYLPFSSFFATNNSKYRSPVRCLILLTALNAFWLLLLPADKSFAYIVNLEGYPAQLFLFFLVVGLYKLRSEIDFTPDIQSSDIGNLLLVLITGFNVLTPFIWPVASSIEGIPPEPVVAIFILLLLIGVWFFQFKLSPWFGGYQLIKMESALKDGLLIKKWVKEYNSK